jgi:hypothetical protein
MASKLKRGSSLTRRLGKTSSGESSTSEMSGTESEDENAVRSPSGSIELSSLRITLPPGGTEEKTAPVPSTIGTESKTEDNQTSPATGAPKSRASARRTASQRRALTLAKSVYASTRKKLMRKSGAADSNDDDGDESDLDETGQSKSHMLQSRIRQLTVSSKTNALDPMLRRVRLYTAIALALMVALSITRYVLMNSFFSTYTDRLQDALTASQRIALVVGAGYRSLQLVLSNLGFVDSTTAAHALADLGVLSNALLVSNNGLFANFETTVSSDMIREYTGSSVSVSSVVGGSYLKTQQSLWTVLRQYAANGVFLSKSSPTAFKETTAEVFFLLSNVRADFLRALTQSAKVHSARVRE